MNALPNAVLAPADTDVPLLAQRAMLVDLSISCWNAYAIDCEVTAHVHTDYEASRDSGAYRKRLLPHDPVSWKAVRQARSSMIAEHKRLTLPWSTGLRILTREGFLDYGRSMAQARACFDAAVYTFLKDYPEQVTIAMDRLGRMANPTDYPNAESLRPLFGVSLEFFPVPTSGDFRVELGSDEVAMIREQIDGLAAQRVQQAQRDLWDRMLGAVAHFSAVLTKVQQASAAKDRGEEVDLPLIRESMLAKLGEVARLAETLDLENDPRLEEIRTEIGGLICDRKDLRDHAGVRAAAISEADRLAAKMRAFMPGARGQQ